MDYAGFFIFGIIFAVIAAVVRVFTGISFKQASLLMLVISVSVIVITEYIGLRAATSQVEIANVTNKALDSVMGHFMFELGGAIVGSFLGILFGEIGKKH